MSVAWSRSGRLRKLLLLSAVAAMVLILSLAALRGGGVEASAGQTIPLGVLGDSDSHSYQDSLSFPTSARGRGGAWRSTTLQWTEVIGRLRADQIDLGRWDTWGTQRGWGGVVGQVQDYVGLARQFPRKQDYEYNMARSGATCEHLNEGPRRQVPRLLALMARDPGRWQRGVVVVRIGINDIGVVDALERQAKDPTAGNVLAQIDNCVLHIRQAVEVVRARQRGVRIVLVGIFNNAHWVPNHTRWRSAAEQSNILNALTRFDDALRAIASATPGVAFFDDQAWFAHHWGGRDDSGRPAYKTLMFGPKFAVGNTQGDHPSNAILEDGHAGTIWNALWAQALVDLMNDRFGTAIGPLTAAEMAAVADPQGTFGMSTRQ